MELAKDLLQNPDVGYLLSDKFNQDVLEEWFSLVRGAGGANTKGHCTFFAARVHCSETLPNLTESFPKWEYWRPCTGYRDMYSYLNANLTGAKIRKLLKTYFPFKRDFIILRDIRLTPQENDCYPSTSLNCQFRKLFQKI